LDCARFIAALGTGVLGEGSRVRCRNCGKFQPRRLAERLRLVCDTAALRRKPARHSPDFAASSPPCTGSPHPRKTSPPASGRRRRGIFVETRQRLSSKLRRSDITGICRTCGAEKSFRDLVLQLIRTCMVRAGLSTPARIPLPPCWPGAVDFRTSPGAARGCPFHKRPSQTSRRTPAPAASVFSPRPRVAQ